MKDNDLHFGQGHMCAGCEWAGIKHRFCPKLDNWRGDPSVGVYKPRAVERKIEKKDDNSPLAKTHQS